MTMAETFSLEHLKLSPSLETQRGSLVSMWKWIESEKRKLNPNHFFYPYGHAYHDVCMIEQASTLLLMFPNVLEDKQTGVVILEENLHLSDFALFVV